MQHRAAPLGGLGQALAVPQRVQAESRANVERAVLMRGVVTDLGEFTLADRLHVDTDIAAHELGLALHRLEALAAFGDFIFAVALGAVVDVFASTQLAHELDRFRGAAMIKPRLFESELADLRLERQLGRAHAAKTAVAPGCAPADVAGLEHAHVELVVARQVVGRGQPGITAADNRDVAVLFAFELLSAQRGLTGRGFPVGRLGFVETVQARMKQVLHDSTPRFEC